MGALKKITGIIAMFLSLIYSAAAQNIGTSFIENLKSGAITQNIKSILGTEIALWLAFFAFFAFAMKFGIERMFPEMKAAAKGGLAISSGLILTYGLVKTGLANLMPQMNIVIFVVIALAIAFALISIKDKDKKPRINLGIALLVGLLISWLLINGASLAAGSGISLFGTALGGTAKETAIQSRILAGAGGMTGVSNDPETNYNLAIEAVNKYDYERAQELFAAVIDTSKDNPNNEYFKKTQQWITESGGDKLFRHMAQHLPPIMSVEREAASIMVTRAEKLSNVDPKKKELLLKAVDLADDVIEKETMLAAEFERKKVT